MTPGALRHYLDRAGRHPWRAARHLPRLWSAGTAFADPHHDAARAVLVAGSARSGTTWLAELLAAGRPVRLVFEPLRRDLVRAARAVPRSYYVPPGTDDPEVEDLLRRILEGRVRSLWSDNHNRCRRAEGRVVKEVRANNLLPLVVRRFGQVPVLWILRHPLAAAYSADQLGMATELDELVSQPRLLDACSDEQRRAAERGAAAGGVEAYVLRWCLEQWLPLRHLRSGQVHVVLYEDLVADPGPVLAGVAAHLAAATTGLWGGWVPPGAGVVGRASGTSWRQRPPRPGAGGGSPADRVGEWVGRVPAAALSRSLALLELFGLSHLYGEGPRPLVGAGAVLAPGPDAPGRR